MFSLFSVDDHIIEPADVWSSRVPVKFRDTAPHGRKFVSFEDKKLALACVRAWNDFVLEEWCFKFPLTVSD